MAIRKPTIWKQDTAYVPEAGSSPFPGYRLIRLRGRGGFAEVWEAEDPDGEHIALKFLSAQKLSATARELRALRAIHSIEHPFLLKTKHVWSVPGSIVIGMELADATMLDLFLLYEDELHQPMELEKLLCQLYQAALGIDYLNARHHDFDGRYVGLQHGDVKPNNLMIVGDYVKLADYGLATPITTTSTPCHRHGTLDYVAPEVMQGTLTDTSDQFGLAVTYYVLRAGSFPFPPPPKPDDVKKSGLHRPPPDLSLVPANERPIIAKALSTIPQDRYSSCAEFMRMLARVYGLEFITAPESGRVPVIVRPIRSATRVVVA
jgi:serine/threonine protein kinase